MKIRNRLAAAFVAAAIVVGGAVVTTEPAQASSTYWSHGSSYAACQANLKSTVTSLRAQGYQTSKPSACAPNPYRAGWWRSSFTYWR